MKNGIILTFVLIIIFSLTSSAQDSFKRRVVYGELLGSGVFGSINYDFRFKEGNDGLGMRVGGGFLPGTLVIPVEVNGLIGKKRLSFEYGIGLSTAFFFSRDQISEDLTFSDSMENVGTIAYAKLGVRLTPLDNGLFLNFNYNPMFNVEGPIPVWFGLGIGYSWKRP